MVSKSKKKRTKKSEKDNKTKDLNVDKPKKYKPDFRKLKKLTPAQKEALRLKAKYPNDTDKDISLRLIDKGLSKDSNYLSIAKRQNTTMKSELARIEEANMHILAAQIVPKALELHQEALNDKRMSKNDKFKYIKLGEDSYFKQLDRKVAVKELNVNIAGIQNFIQKALDGDVPPVDVTPGQEESQDN